MSANQDSILDRILASTRDEVAKLKHKVSEAELLREAQAAPEPRDIVAALDQCSQVAVIAEIKRRSPSAGDLAQGVNPAKLAATYQAGGASAISVLTDGPFFGGSIDDLRQAREAVDLPILRKDFVVDVMQVIQARAAGADAVLLIAAALEAGHLAELYQCCGSLGMHALIEVHRADELDKVLDLDPPLIGINNRDLSTLKVDLATCLNIRPLIANHALVVAESGIQGPDDVKRLLAGGLDAFLVGTRLMLAGDPQAALSALVQAGGES